MDIALHGSAAHEKRRTEVYRSVRTLDDLTEQLQKDGFQISRSGVYLHLQPRSSATHEGKRHVKTIPVKLIRAQNDAHSRHIDGRFCAQNMKRLEELSSILGPQEVFYVSQDDKCRVPIGTTAANKQSPFLMHMEYRVMLPDHDWVVAAAPKLIPSVYGAVEIQKDGLGKPESVGFSGPTYIGIRSGKHSSSTALSHAVDFESLINLPEFESFAKVGVDKLLKPVLVFSVDGGPDENPRYQKVIDVSIHHFLRHNLDAIFIACNAPGRSAFNRVERRMAPLSRDLSGLILPHEHFGSHLNNSGLTVDVELEKQNFQYAGETLAEIWSGSIIDSFPVIAHYIVPENSEMRADQLETRSIEWFSTQGRTSQYFTQIVKCEDTGCCSKPRGSYFTVMPSRFLPPLIPLSQSRDFGLIVPERENFESHKFPSLFAGQLLKMDIILPRSTHSFKVLPYDLYCPSIQSLLVVRCCKTCHLYFASVAILKKHMAIHREQAVSLNAPKMRPMRVAARRQRELMAVIAVEENGEHVDWMEEEELDLVGIPVPNDEAIPPRPIPVYSIDQHLSCPWINTDH
ncbi:uncharacterized protein LOC116918320 [Daphnia magna]|uniref:uncharacterized protein LOC116918320 n=1 Tax=Daphnia magna TaxID=35525 RepID=UPI001E1BC99C|nr:uncharacterized protein LOC116918320 [Daphnia magna]